MADSTQSPTGRNGVVKIRDVAARAGVSVGTVSNVLNRPDYVSDENRVKVQRAMSELGFIRNDLARQLRQKQSRTYGLITLSLTNPFFGEVAHAAQAQAERDGFTVLVGSSDFSPEREDRYIELFELQQVRGLMIAPNSGVSERLQAMRRRGVPIVLFDSVGRHEGFSAVFLDGVEGGRLAGEHLIRSGRRRLLFTGGPLAQVSDRLAGVSDAVTKAEGVSLQVIETSDMTVSDGLSVGLQIVGLPEALRPDGVFAANDQMAFGIIQALTQAGLEVPAAIGVIGYDDIPFAATGTVPLTTVRQPVEEIATAAVTLLHEQAELGSAFSPQTVRLQPELILRRSA
ncbi:LacI family DNA-binding transcriptional regulator [Herbiconiux sp. A18JL235]|uniref:LacI family DNA-binding transcriptional regulator n=1 Tax=Herbiconiux sp. A18JL235 TaxID=3152363 RepID=A0AB39BHT6_9MICO